MASEQHINTGAAGMDHVMKVVDGFKSTMVVIAACKLELFDLLEKEGQATAASLADRHGWNPDATERLLNCLVALELIRKELQSEQEYAYSVTDVGKLLIRHAPVTIWDYTQNLERFMHSFEQLPEEVKTGANQGEGIPYHVVVHKTKPEEEVKSQEKVAPTHGHQHKPMAILDRYRMYEGQGKMHVHALAKAFDLNQHKNTVDLGGGSGTLAFELSRIYKNMNVVLFDVPNVIELVQKHFIPKDKDQLKVTLVPGDFFENELPDGDLYILSKIVHDWGSKQTVQLLQKVAAKLETGGGIILMEKCLTDAKDGPVSGHVWDLLVMGHCGGRLRSGKEYRQLLTSTGFTDIRIAKTQADCSYDVIYAKKA